MDNLLKQSKAEAQQIREKAMKSAEEMKASFNIEMEKLKESYLEGNKIKVEKDIDEMRIRAKKDAAVLQNRGRQNIEKGVELLMKTILP